MEIVEEVVLVAAARTPFGRLGGGLSTVTALELGAVVIRGGRYSPAGICSGIAQGEATIVRVPAA
jgi:acetyl-CoA acetyltransferase